MEVSESNGSGSKQETLVRYFTTMVDIDKTYGKNETRKDRRKVMTVFRSLCTDLINRVPLINVLKTYQWKQFLLLDLVAGLALIGLHFPQGLAYGILAGLTPNIGLISTLFPVLLYMVFGSSPHSSIGTNAIVSIIVGDLFLEDNIKKQIEEITLHQTLVSVNETNNTNISEDLVMKYKISLVAGVTFYTGLIFSVMAIFRMGFLVTYLSQSFMSGFTTGVAVHIFSSQVKVAFGLKLPATTGVGKLVVLYYSVFKNIATTNVPDLIVSIICIVVLLCVKLMVNEKFKLKTPIPIDFLLLVISTLISHYAQLPARFGIQDLGKVELGIPLPEIPAFQPANTLIVHAIEIAMVTFFLNISVTKLVAKHHDYEIDENIETSAYALTNLFSSFLSCIAASVAPPRSLLLSTMGAKTTLNAVATSVLMLSLIYYFGQFFESCPRPVLAAMIMVAMKDLLRQVTMLPKLWKINKNDFTTWLFAALSCILLDIPYGLALGVLVSLVSVISQSQRGRVSILEKSDIEDLYLDRHDYCGVSEIPGIRIIRIEASLYFATAEKFRKSIMKCISNKSPKKDVPTPSKVNTNNNTEDVTMSLTNMHGNQENKVQFQEKIDLHMNDLHDNNGIKVLIIDCIPVNFIDTTGLDILKLVFVELSYMDIKLYLARCSRYMLRLLEKSDFYDCVPKEHVFVDVPDAVAFAKIEILEKHKATKEQIENMLKLLRVRSFSSFMVDSMHDPYQVGDRNYNTIH